MPATGDLASGVVGLGDRALSAYDGEPATGDLAPGVTGSGEVDCSRLLGVFTCEVGEPVSVKVLFTLFLVGVETSPVPVETTLAGVVITEVMLGGG